jgi:hypothetical protein
MLKISDDSSLHRYAISQSLSDYLLGLSSEIQLCASQAMKLCVSLCATF